MISLITTSTPSTRGAEMTVHDPRTNKPTDAKVRVVGQDSATYRTNLRRIRDAVAAARRRSRPTRMRRRCSLVPATPLSRHHRLEAVSASGGAEIELQLRGRRRHLHPAPLVRGSVLGFTSDPGKLRARLTDRLCAEVRRISLRQTAQAPVHRSWSGCRRRRLPLEAFWELEETRQSAWVLLPFTHQENRRLLRNMDVRLRPWEVRNHPGDGPRPRAVLAPPKDGEDEGPKVTRKSR